MKKKKVQMIVEASSTGFGVYSPDDFPVTGYGDTVADAKENLKNGIKELLEYYKEAKKKIDPRLNNGNLEFVFKYDVGSIFNYFPMLDMSNFAQRIKMNASLLRQYKTGKTFASDKQKKKIQKGLHEIGRELINVQL